MSAIIIDGASSSSSLVPRFNQERPRIWFHLIKNFFLILFPLKKHFSFQSRNFSACKQTGGTHFLRADGSLSDTPLPERFQIVLDFTILDLKAWNAVMDRFHLQDICEQILQEQQKGEMNSMELERLAEYAKALYQSVKMSEI